MTSSLATILFLFTPLVPQDLSPRLQPVTALRSFDGYYDLATGRLVRGVRAPNEFVTADCPQGLEPASALYDNTCQANHWLPLQPTSASGGTASEELGDYATLPSFSFAGDGSCSVGLRSEYDIGQLTIAWCSQAASRPSASIRFWSPPQQACSGTIPSPGSALFSATLTGLPRASLPGVTSCYTLDVYFGQAPFSLQASDAFTTGDVQGEKLAWSISFPSGEPDTGPVLAGEVPSAPCAPCTGTLWEVGGQSTNAGTGSGQDAFVFLETYGGTGQASGDCFHFGSGGPAGLYGQWAGGLADSVSIPSTVFCNGIDGSTSSCPCGSGDVQTGCDVPRPAMQGGGTTGGVSLNVVRQRCNPNRTTLVSAGYPTLSMPSSVIFRSNGLDPQTPVVFGDGLRCVSGVGVVRVGGTTALAGSATHTFGHGTMVGAGTFFYQAWFRSFPASYCDPTAAFNLSSGLTLEW